MIGTINCIYETPCGWCTKWNKECDKAMDAPASDYNAEHHKQRGRTAPNEAIGKINFAVNKDGDIVANGITYDEIIEHVKKLTKAASEGIYISEEDK